MAPVITRRPCQQRRHNEQRLRRVAFEGRELLHPGHHGGIEANAGVEQEIALIELAQTDPVHRAGA